MDSTIHGDWKDTLDALEKNLIRVQNPSRARSMRRYMKEKFDYYGISSPQRKILLAPYKKQLLQQIDASHLSDVLFACWEYEQREWQYIGLEMIWSARKYWTDDTIELIERLIVSKSWWDTVDMLAGKVSGAWFVRFPETRYHRVRSWIQSDHMWLQRSAIIHQLGYKQNTDKDLLLESIKPHVPSKEFFLRKAIGWALRQYSRTDPEWVSRVAQTYPLSALSRKEALRLIE